jgi:hypothetical protein
MSANTTQAPHSHIPPVKGLHNQIRHSRYQAEDCILEFYDNAIDAKAKHVETILYSRSEDFSDIERIVTMDTGGKGMNSTELLQGITIAFQRSGRDADIGAYGFGLNSGALNLGDELLVVSKRPDAEEFVGARLNFREQERTNNYAPTQYTAAASKDLFSHLPSEISEKLRAMEGTSASATVVQVSGLHLPIASTSCGSFKERLTNRMRLAYSATDLPNLELHIRIFSSEGQTEVNRIDPLYLNSVSTHLKRNPIRLDLLAVIPTCQTDGIRIIEKNTCARPYKKQAKKEKKERGQETDASNKELYVQTTGTPDAPVYYEIGKETMKVVQNPYETMNTSIKEIIPFSMLFSYLKKSTYDAEDEDMCKKGIWFQRGPRMVAQGLTLGMHGLSAHGHQNQMRALVKFPPKLDAYMGVNYNKSIDPKTGAMKDAIIHLWKDITGKWTKDKEIERKQPVPPVELKKEETHEENTTEESPDDGASEQTSQTDSIATEETEVIPVPPREPLHEMSIREGLVELIFGDRTLASVNGYGKNSQLRTYLERILLRKGPDFTTQFMTNMNTMLTA